MTFLDLLSIFIGVAVVLCIISSGLVLYALTRGKPPLKKIDDYTKLGQKE